MSGYQSYSSMLTPLLGAQIKLFAMPILLLLVFIIGIAAFVAFRRKTVNPTRGNQFSYWLFKVPLAAAGLAFYLYFLIPCFLASFSADGNAIASFPVSVASAPLLPDSVKGTPQNPPRQFSNQDGELSLRVLVFRDINRSKELVQVLEPVRKNRNNEWNWEVPIKYEDFQANFNLRVDYIQPGFGQRKNHWTTRGRYKFETASYRATGGGLMKFDKLYSAGSNSYQQSKSLRYFGPSPIKDIESPFWIADDNIEVYCWLNFVPKGAEIKEINLATLTKNLLKERLNQSSDDHAKFADNFRRKTNAGTPQLIQLFQERGALIVVSILIGSLTCSLLFRHASICFPCLCFLFLIGFVYADYLSTHEHLQTFQSKQETESARIVGLASARCSIFHRGRVQKKLQETTDDLPANLAKYVGELKEWYEGEE